MVARRVAWSNSPLTRNIREREREKGSHRAAPPITVNINRVLRSPAELYAKTATKLRIKAGFEVDFEEEEERSKYAKWWNFNFFFF